MADILSYPAPLVEFFFDRVQYPFGLFGLLVESFRYHMTYMILQQYTLLYDKTQYYKMSSTASIKERVLYLSCCILRLLERG